MITKEQLNELLDNKSVRFFLAKIPNLTTLQDIKNAYPDYKEQLLKRISEPELLSQFTANESIERFMGIFDISPYDEDFINSLEAKTVLMTDSFRLEPHIMLHHTLTRNQLNNLTPESEEMLVARLEIFINSLPYNYHLATDHKDDSLLKLQLEIGKQKTLWQGKNAIIVQLEKIEAAANRLRPIPTPALSEKLIVFFKQNREYLKPEELDKLPDDLKDRFTPPG